MVGELMVIRERMSFYSDFGMLCRNPLIFVFPWFQDRDYEFKFLLRLISVISDKNVSFTDFKEMYTSKTGNVNISKHNHELVPLPSKLAIIRERRNHGRTNDSDWFAHND